MKKYQPFLLVLFILVFGCQAGQELSTDNVPRVSKEDLKARLDSEDVILVDVRAEQDWAQSTSKIRGAIRKEPESVDSWASELAKDKTVVLYCA